MTAGAGAGSTGKAFWVPRAAREIPVYPAILPNGTARRWNLIVCARKGSRDVK